MGCDMPALRRSIIIEGFERLHELCDRPDGGIVLAPDQEMGVSVVGWTRDTAFDHTGVFYNADGLTVLPPISRRPTVWVYPRSICPMFPMSIRSPTSITT